MRLSSNRPRIRCDRDSRIYSAADVQRARERGESRSDPTFSKVTYTVGRRIERAPVIVGARSTRSPGSMNKLSIIINYRARDAMLRLGLTDTIVSFYETDISWNNNDSRGT